MNNTFHMFKFIHLLGMTLFVGDIIIAALFKVMGDRSSDMRVRHFAQRVLILTDKVFLLPGAVLLVIGGYAMAGLFNVPVWTTPSLLLAQILFFISGAIWAVGLAPLQNTQLAMLAAACKDGTGLDARYDALSRRWMMLGISATILPIGSAILMIMHA